MKNADAGAPFGEPARDAQHPQRDFLEIGCETVFHDHWTLSTYCRL
tara:strand:+ start:350 stop:487 length:138 start_codon:yes stop_codon:yes gene_type:complete